ncbi:hypothetical protein ACNKHK_24215 [Shigella flexneri]
MGVFLCWRLRDRPQAIGLPPIRDWRHDELEIARAAGRCRVSRRDPHPVCAAKSYLAAVIVLCAGVSRPCSD